MTAAIEISGIHKHFPGVHALKGVDLTIRRGEFFGLLGPNGAGKSTLINILAGLTRADSGVARIMGHEVARDYRRARRCLGVVPQELVFDPFFTVREVLRIQSGYFGLGRDNDDWIDELLDALMLGSKAHSNMRALSGGMKRRVLIAQALVHKPEVVILDEPTAGVDVELRNSLWGFVSRLHQEGHTIVLTTHYLEEAESLCDRIAIMNLGNIVALDDKQALLQRQIDHPRRLHVTLDKPVPPLSESLTERLISSQGNQLVLRLDAQESTVMELLEQIRDCGVDVVDVNCQLPDLEDIFLNLTMKPAQ